MPSHKRSSADTARPHSSQPVGAGPHLPYRLTTRISINCVYVVDTDEDSGEWEFTTIAYGLTLAQAEAEGTASLGTAARGAAPVSVARGAGRSPLALDATFESTPHH
jgi:hypothetical protein